tara:strand:- start:109 stop:270 length:162 start_codon:yes stop_codon:yes gene_type:complete
MCCTPPNARRRYIDIDIFIYVSTRKSSTAELPSADGKPKLPCKEISKDHADGW